MKEGDPNTPLHGLVIRETFGVWKDGGTCSGCVLAQVLRFLREVG